MAVKQRGRPPALSADEKDLILEAIESGVGTRRACADLGVETSTFYLTLNRDPDFMERYQAARAAGVDALVDDADEAAEDARRAENGHQVAGAKVYIDHKMRVASRLAPQRWGEKAQVHVTGQISTDEQDMAKRVAFLQALRGYNDEGAGDDADPYDPAASGLL